MSETLSITEQQEIERLKDLACEMRKKLLYLCGHYSGSVHIGGELSMADLLIALFHHALHINPQDISLSDRDRFLLSKGHGAVCMYIAMAMRGFFDYGEILSTYGKVDSAFGMHPCKVHLPGVECSSGSLGHGLSMAVGMALSAKYRHQTHRVVCMLGDGETIEGSVWEAAIAAPSYRLGNLIALIDRNKQFMTSFSEDPIRLEPYADKWKAFGWNTVEIDGHDMAQIVRTLDTLPAPDSDIPTAIVCHTIKGKGVSFMEHNIGWHAGSLSLEDMERAIAEVDAARFDHAGCETTVEVIF